MGKVIILLTLAVASLAAPNLTGNLKKASSCDPDKCKIPDCRCFSTDIPGGLNTADTPQFVLLTFDDAIRADNYNYYKQAFYGKKNPDGCDVAATYFMSHEYTDYSKVHDLYEHGHEIALHSITHSPLTTYWKNISIEDLTNEFDGERDLISYFANIPADSLKGMRLPFLQLSGDNSFEMMKNIGLKYDCSWPTQSYINPGVWPYTLDYLSPQDCPIGPCPQSAVPAEWVVPMIDWEDLEQIVCAMVDSCQNVPTKEDEILEWYKTNFNTHYNGNKAPFGFYVHAAWFLTEPAHFSAYLKFVDYLQTIPDVYIVNLDRALDWVRNPVPLGSPDWPKCPEVVQSPCTAISCQLHNEKGEERYMTICTEDCPKNYPWIGNPLGK